MAKRQVLLVFKLLIVMVFVLGCDDKKKQGTGTQDTPEQGTKSAAEKEAEAKAKRQKLQAEMFERAKVKLQKGEDLNEKEYEVMVLSLETCEVDKKRGYVDSDCDAFSLLKKARAQRNKSVPDQPQMWRLIAQRNLSHESPAVRIYSAQLLASTFASKKESYDILLDASRKEESPLVLLAIVRGLRMQTGKDSEVAERLIELSNHESSELREGVLIGLTSLWAVGSKDTLERALEMIKTDPSMDVRKVGCSNLGSRADERALPLLEEYTAWPPKEEELYNDCFRGLVAMWSAPVPHKQPSQKAYELTMKLLSAKPRTEKSPSWMAFSNLAWANKPELLKRAPYIDIKELRAVMLDIVADKDYSWLGRNAAISVLLRLEVTAKELESVRKSAYSKEPEGTSPDKYVRKKLDEEIARMNDKK